MKSSVIPKEEANKFKIENFFENLQSTPEPTLVDKILEINRELSQEEKDKIDKILETFFLYRRPNVELARKFRDLFEEEVEKNRGVTPSQKFVDFLITKKLSGSFSRKKSNIVEPSEHIEVKPIHSFAEEESDFPKIIRNQNGEITAIEVRCKCGEIIHLDIEFE
ncbi:MAG: hypothetical protein CH6_2653 [Candidatus Kapaibacterium sp.]|jgi:uncharacterized protein YdaU (DUF1376 family)|nr:MAG: hypothetical protein CH6_2653 [Candidatus Kapabacteria bacterium]ROL56696.1 MAG: hypothetical protein D9V84_06605 [Bacteroidetes/Chlorobi group bacterium Naka2016]